MTWQARYQVVRNKGYNYKGLILDSMVIVLTDDANGSSLGHDEQGSINRIFRHLQIFR